MTDLNADETKFLTDLCTEVYSRPTTYVYDKSENGCENPDTHSCSYLNYRDIGTNSWDATRHRHEPGFTPVANLEDAKGSCIFGRVIVNNEYLPKSELLRLEGTGIREILKRIEGDSENKFSNAFKEAMTTIQMTQDAGHPQSLAFMRGLAYLASEGYDVKEFLFVPNHSKE